MNKLDCPNCLEDSRALDELYPINNGLRLYQCLFCSEFLLTTHDIDSTGTETVMITAYVIEGARDVMDKDFRNWLVERDKKVDDYRLNAKVWSSYTV